MKDQEPIRLQWRDCLLEAWREGRSKDPEDLPSRELSLREAYDVQDLLIQERLGQGEEIVGWKVGATSQAVMEQLGIREPILGCITSGSLQSRRRPVKASRFVRLAAEGEIAFVMSRNVAGPGVTSSDVMEAAEGVLGAVELVDCRITGWHPTPAQAIADNALHAGVIPGPVVRSPQELDLGREQVVIRKNREQLALATGSEALGHPANVVAWLANKLTRLNKGLEKGQMVLTGSLTHYIPLAPGDTVEAAFSTLGTISFTLE